MLTNMSAAKFVERGYGQVEPNHLSAQRTAQIYAQLPAAKAINKLEQGQFVKYDYRNGVVDFDGAGEWMLVFNEIKLYRDGQQDCEFAMLKDNYNGRIYSPFGGDINGNPDVAFNAQSRYYNGKDDQGNTSITIAGKTYTYDDVTAGVDPYEPHYTEDPFHIASGAEVARMPEGTTMVPRVFKTNIGDIFTTNTVDETTLALGDELAPRKADGILVKSDSEGADTDSGMIWQVVKVYTLPDHQKAVKVMRIA